MGVKPDDMKHLFYALVCVAAVAVACSEKPEIVLEPESNVRTVTLTASLSQTKVDVNMLDGKVTWAAGDAVAVWNTEGTKFRFDIESGEGTSLATFKCSTFEGTLGAKAVYPYEWAGAAAGTVTIPEYIAWVDGYVPAVMASTVSEITAGEVAPLYFHSLMTIMDFTLQDVPAYACAFKIWSKTGADLHGTWTVSADCTSLTDITTGGNTQQVIYFPYKTAYGAEATMKIRAAVPSYSYTDLMIRVLDGDETVIEGTGKMVPTSVTSLMGADAGAYIVMPALNIRSLVGSARDNYIKVEGVKWAKGNLRVKQEASYEDGWQAGFNLFDYQWQTAYAETDAVTVTEPKTSDVARSTTFYDLFNWGGLGRSCQYNNSGYITPTTAKFDISGRVFSAREGDKDALDAAEVTGDDRFHYWDVFSGYNGGVSDAENGIGNPTIFGDLAFWASKGQYRMPTSSEIVKLRTNNTAATGQAGYYNTPGGDTVFGVLLTSTPSWTSASMNTTAVELSDADLESGLFLPKAGRRSSTETHSKIRFFDNQGVYWSSTFGSLAADHETSSTILAWRLNYTCDYGYTTNLNGNEWGDVKAGNCIRPVLVD